jgi:heme-degrading monooxygenase HmoA
MFFVYVKHYLNEEGLQFFQENWYPRVYEAIKVQPGFVSIESNKSPDDPGCVNITLIFVSQAKLQDWAKTATHDHLIDLLDPYRYRDWEVATLDKPDDGKSVNPSNRVWERVTPRNIANECTER